MDDEILYEVEQIKGVRFSDDRDRLEYQIKWKNYDESYENTWEPEENLACPILLKQFWDGSSKEEFMHSAKKGKAVRADGNVEPSPRKQPRHPAPQQRSTQQKPQQKSLSLPRTSSSLSSSSSSSTSSLGMGTRPPSRLEIRSEARKRLRDEADQRLKQKKPTSQVHKVPNRARSATNPRIVPQRKDKSYLLIKRSAQPPKKPISYGIDELIVRVSENAMDRRNLPSSLN